MPPKVHSLEEAKSELNLVLPTQSSQLCPLPSGALKVGTDFLGCFYLWVQGKLLMSPITLHRGPYVKNTLQGCQPLSGRSFKSFLSFILWFSYQLWGLCLLGTRGKRADCNYAAPANILQGGLIFWRNIPEGTATSATMGACLELFFPSCSTE